jgi:hypothetical protein
MRPSSAATVGILLSLALILPACGDERAASADRTVGPPGTAQAKAPATNSPCRSQLHDFLGSMDALRDRLAVGLNYEDYLREVRAVKAVYEGIPVDRLAIGCLAATGSPGERALNRYLDAANTWGDCLAATSCETESLEAKLRRKWALASDLLSAAQQGLRSS